MTQIKLISTGEGAFAVVKDLNLANTMIWLSDHQITLEKASEIYYQERKKEDASS